MNTNTGKDCWQYVGFKGQRFLLVSLDSPAARPIQRSAFVGVCACLPAPNTHSSHPPGIFTHKYAHTPGQKTETVTCTSKTICMAATDTLLHFTLFKQDRKIEAWSNLTVPARIVCGCVMERDRDVPSTTMYRQLPVFIRLHRHVVRQTVCQLN